MKQLLFLLFVPIFLVAACGGVSKSKSTQDKNHLTSETTVKNSDDAGSLLDPSSTPAVLGQQASCIDAHTDLSTLMADDHFFNMIEHLVKHDNLPSEQTMINAIKTNKLHCQTHNIENRG